MTNLIRISSIKSSSCFYECYKTSEVFTRPKKRRSIYDDTFNHETSTLLTYMSCSWYFNIQITLHNFSINRFNEAKLTPFSYTWNKKILFSHEIFRSASLSTIEDFEVSNYDEVGNLINEKEGFTPSFSETMENDYDFYIYRVYN